MTNVNQINEKYRDEVTGIMEVLVGRFLKGGITAKNLEAAQERVLAAYAAASRKGGDVGARAEVTLSERVKALLARRGLTANALAVRAGMERQQVWRIVSGLTPNPGILTVERLVAAAGATMADLYTDTPTTDVHQ